ncbi:MAG: DUF3035 domain-containing protein [Alphaproteobacteria bacterium]|nr:DUF3035 domain-containing protein [Alphaproteobacteria bacterium]
MKTTLKILTVGALAVSVSACIGGNRGASGPDEFRVVKKAPLIVPPDYSLRPPTPGQAQPFEVDEARAGVATAFGTNVGVDASAAERALVNAAGANAVSPVIREQVDFEEARIIRKSTSISDRVMFWQKGGEEDDGSDSATGDAPVTIERGSGERLKLPGT